MVLKTTVDNHTEPLTTEALCRATDRRLVELVATETNRAQVFSPQFESLWQGIGRSIEGGKRERPRLFLDSYLQLGGADRAVAVDTASALELLHTALVIHDDVIDNDYRRRGMPNIAGHFRAEALKSDVSFERASAWGAASSILAGDLLLARSQSMLARLDVPARHRSAVLDTFDQTVLASAAGEHSDVWLSLAIEQASSLELFAMIEQKTAVYSFQAPLALAGILADASPTVLQQLSAIAKHIGIIYQLRDDVLGVFGHEHQTGKSRDSDLREGKATLLIAFARLDPAWELVEPLFGRPDLSRADADQLRAAIRRSGALLLIEAAIAEQRDVVEPLIRSADLPSTLQRKFLSLVQTSGERTS